MNSWLTKFRISAALDAGRPFSESLRRKIAADPELESFARRAQAMGRALQSPPPAGPELHNSIMRAVRASAQREQPRREPVWQWLTASATLAALAVVCFWMGSQRPKMFYKPSLNGPGLVLEMSETMPAAMPSLVMSPLTDEWARVDRDVQDTTKVLLASLP